MYEKGNNLVGRVEDKCALKRNIEFLRNYIYEHKKSLRKILSLRRASGIGGNKQVVDLRLNTSEWKRIAMDVNLVSNSFIDRLQAIYKLPYNDIVICTLTLLKMSNKEIMILTGMNQEYIKKNKWRMKTRIFKIQQNQTLEDFLSDFQDKD